MNSIVVLNHHEFDDFLENEKTEATVFTDEENLSRFEINSVIEVWKSAPSIVQGQRYLAIIVEEPFRFNGIPNMFKIKVCKIGNLN